jgi:hypothetical protein
MRSMTRVIVGTMALLFSVSAARPAGAADSGTIKDSSKAAVESPAPANASTNDLVLFDGKTLHGWEVTDFAGHGEAKVDRGRIFLQAGVALTGVTWTNEAVLPKTNYEVSLEAMKVDGSDFFCGLTFPYEKSYCTLIMGGWGGGVVGISSFDSQDASENDTTRFLNFDTNRWYQVRVRVTHERIQVWIDKDQTINTEINGREVGLRAGEIYLSKPLGIATWQTSGAIRNIVVRKLVK